MRHDLGRRSPASGGATFDDVTSALPIAPEPPCEPRCSWSHHGWKHTAKRGFQPEQTRHRPAKYLPTLRTDQIRDIERATIAIGERVTSGTMARYLRDVGEVIGYDLGEPASASFVVCSGGEVEGRAFHGRPMLLENRTVEGFAP